MDMSGAINAAIRANPGAVIDARCFRVGKTGGTSHPQTWTQNMFAGVSTPGELLLGAVNVTVFAEQTVPSGWRILGAGPGVTVISGSHTPPGAIFQIGSSTHGGTSNVRIETLEINGNGATAPVIPIQIQGATSVWVTRSYIHDGHGTNIGIDTNSPAYGSAQIHIVKNRIGPTHDCGLFDVQASPLTTDFFIKENLIFGGQCYGIGSDGSSRGVISGNDISSTGNSAHSGGGIQVEATNGSPSNIVITDNVIHDFTARSAAFGIAFVNGTSNRALADVVIARNVIENFSGRGIVAGNVNGFAGTKCQDVVIDGNAIHEVTLAGIRVARCDDIQVAANDVYDVGILQTHNEDQDGISIESSTGFTVAGNRIADVPSNVTTRYAISLEGPAGDGVIVSNCTEHILAGPVNARERRPQ